MKEIVQYVVKHPRISAVINKENVDSTLLIPYKKDQMYADTWIKAHDFLRDHTMQRVNEANDELNKAIKHLNDVLAMTNPD